MSDYSEDRKQTLSYEKRNHEIYKILSKTKIFVVPDPLLHPLDHLPRFAIIYDDFRKHVSTLSYNVFNRNILKRNRTPIIAQKTMVKC